VQLPLQTAFTKLVLCCKTPENVKSENDCNSDMVNNWQHLCQKLDVPAEVALNNFTGVDDDDTVVQELIKDGTVSLIIMEGQRNYQ